MPFFRWKFSSRKKQGPTSPYFHLCSATYHWSCDLKTSELKGCRAALDYYLRLRLNRPKLVSVSSSAGCILGDAWVISSGITWGMPISISKSLMFQSSFHGSAALCSLLLSKLRVSTLLFYQMHCRHWYPCKESANWSQVPKLSSELPLQWLWLWVWGFWQPNPDSCHNYPWTPKANMQINRNRQSCSDLSASEEEYR